MTLVGLLPPICDNGNMLVDGGYGEWEPLAKLTSRLILPFHSGQLAVKFAVARRLAELLTRMSKVSAMLAMGASAVIASDVGSVRLFGF